MEKKTKDREPLDSSTPLKYIKRKMMFVESPVFTEAALKHLPDDEFSEVQVLLSAHPEAGDLIIGGKDFVNYGGKPKAEAKEGAFGSYITGGCRETKFFCWICLQRTKPTTSLKSNIKPLSNTSGEIFNENRTL